MTVLKISKLQGFVWKTMQVSVTGWKKLFFSNKCFFENFEITRICMKNHASKCDWMEKVVFLKQMLPTFGGRCNRCFWDIRLKILRLPNFNMLFSFCWQNFSKVNCFLVYRKSITWSSHTEPIALYPVHTFKCVLFCEVEMYQFCNSQTVHFVKASKYIWGQNWSDVVKAKIPGESKLTSV